MDSIIVDDEKKPFDAEGPQEEENLPDPDEQLMLDQGNGRVWLVKIPKYLMERWCAIDAEDVHLATIRVYSEAVGASGKKPRIVLFLPPANDSDLGSQSPNPNRPVFNKASSYPSSIAEPDSYELDMVNDAVDNQMVVAERPKDSLLSSDSGPINPRARTTILTGRIKHDCNLRPLFTESYRRQMKERSKKYNTPQRQIKMIEEAGVSGGRGGINRLSSGVGVGSGNAFESLIKSKPKPAKGTFERMARMPRNQLFDLLFNLFRDTPRWGVKVLREKTQQPEAYLKEVLGEIAWLHRSGEYNGLWELKDNFKSDGIKGEGSMTAAAMSQMPADMNVEGVDEEEDDDDMEEVS